MKKSSIDCTKIMGRKVSQSKPPFQNNKNSLTFGRKNRLIKTLLNSSEVSRRKMLLDLEKVFSMQNTFFVCNTRLMQSRND